MNSNLTARQTRRARARLAAPIAAALLAAGTAGAALAQDGGAPAAPPVAPPAAAPAGEDAPEPQAEAAPAAAPEKAAPAPADEAPADDAPAPEAPPPAHAWPDDASSPAENTAAGPTGPVATAAGAARRDPFATDRAMWAEARRQHAPAVDPRAPDGRAARPAPVAAPKLPALRLAGSIEDEKGTLALLQADGGKSLIVAEGDLVTLSAPDGASVLVLVKKLDSRGVVLEEQSTKQMVVVR